nr:unnamed protein product [Naegleria fowleri]
MSRFAVEEVLKSEEAIQEATKHLLKPKPTRDKTTPEPEAKHHKRSSEHPSSKSSKIVCTPKKQSFVLYPHHHSSNGEPHQNYSSKRDLFPKLTSFNLFLKKMNEISLSEERHNRSPTSMSHISNDSSRVENQ